MKLPRSLWRRRTLVATVLLTAVRIVVGAEVGAEGEVMIEDHDRRGLKREAFERGSTC